MQRIIAPNTTGLETHVDYFTYSLDFYCPVYKAFIVVSFLYRLIFLGDPAVARLAELRQLLDQSLKPFELMIDQEVELLINPVQLPADNLIPTAALFLGGDNVQSLHLDTLLARNIPILPIASAPTRVSHEIPRILQSLNCLCTQDSGIPRIVTALLECLGLLPHQRRLFLSYRRNESQQAALQLFEALSARVFDVFLDTHSIPPAVDFQSVLWKRLCNADAILVLDTPGYFESRWASAEYGRALNKSIPILRVSWPTTTLDSQRALSVSYELQDQEIDLDTGLISINAIKQICLQIEERRSKGIAMRRRILADNLRKEIESIGGTITGTSANYITYIQLAGGKKVVAHPTIGLPTAVTLQNAMQSSPNHTNIIVFDSVGLKDWLGHIQWIATQIPAVKWMDFRDIGWNLADWEAM